MKEITTEARIENIRVITDTVVGELETFGCRMKAQMQIELALDEMVTNVASYAYAPGTGNVTVQVDFEPETGMAAITLIDSGIPFNPLEKKDPDTSLPAEERGIGGLGIFLVKKNMDELSYERLDGRNVFRMKKKIV